MSVAVGSRLGPYLVGERVGSAGSGEWFVASEAGLERPVSLVVTPLPGDQAALVALRERARRLVAVTDARLLPVYGQGEDEHVLWLATRQIVGLPFPQLGRLEERRAARLGVQLAGQLGVLQDAGIAPALLTGDDLVVEGEGEKERAWLLPDPLRPVADDASGATRSLAALLETQAGRPLLTEAPSDPQTLAEQLAPKAGRPDQRRKLIVAAAATAVVAATAVGLTLALTNNDTNTSKQAAADTPIARVTAHIPLGAVLDGLAVDKRHIWASISERGDYGGLVPSNLIHIDPKTNTVIGAPIRLRPKDSYGYVALDGNTLWSTGSHLIRLDAATGDELGRVGLGAKGEMTSLLVTNRAIWGTVRNGQGIIGRAVKIDPATMKVLRRSRPFGSYPILAAATDDEVWAANYADGTVSRVAAGGAVTTIAAGLQTGLAVTGNGRLWIPTGVSGTLIAVDPKRMTIEGVTHVPGFPRSVAVGNGSIWVLTLEPSRIYRVDPKTSRVLGSPITAPTGAHLLRFGAGSLWVDDPKSKALVRLAPTLPAPAPRPPAPSSTVLQDGPIPAGVRVRAASVKPPFSIVAPDAGWLAAGLPLGSLNVLEIKDPARRLAIETPSQMFDAAGRLTPVRSAAGFLRVLRNNPQLRVSRVTPVTLGGLNGLRVRVETHPKPPFPELCGGTPCVPLFPINRGTVFLSKGVDELTLVKRGSVLAVIDAWLADGSAKIDPEKAKRLRRLVDSIRFEK